jgi:N utilization substance protein A
VPEDQLSIAIGRGGQNVRLASKLTGYEIDLSAEQAQAPVPEVPSKPAAPKLKKKEQLESSLLEAIEQHGQDSTEQ